MNPSAARYAAELNRSLLFYRFIISALSASHMGIGYPADEGGRMVIDERVGDSTWRNLTQDRSTPRNRHQCGHVKRLKTAPHSRSRRRVAFALRVCSRLYNNMMGCESCIIIPI
ncbi:hypothetical protein EVAR_12222_1 [Eumeta japonica]|uniref:Uncharacterized protein n=1 Tax=Eumeta variegata TaxID=151549 RepID=A0A4C1UIE5_EUMVA|nr:hypothetical protein EVAR_12222_1 [Eumeta japonica]